MNPKKIWIKFILSLLPAVCLEFTLSKADAEYAGYKMVGLKPGDNFKFHDAKGNECIIRIKK